MNEATFNGILYDDFIVFCFVFDFLTPLKSL